MKSKIKYTHLMLEVGCFLDLQTYKFVESYEMPKTAVIGVASTLWRFNEPKEHIDFKHLYRKTKTLRLNHLVVELGSDVADKKIKFFDSTTKKHVVIEFTLDFLYDTSQMIVGAKVAAVSYKMRVNDVKREVMSLFKAPISLPTRFNYINGLGFVDYFGEELSYGLLHEQYDVYYRGHKLSGTSYAFLDGPWGILLDDELRFDSLAFFDKIIGKELHVESFGYTVNPYIVKMMTLVK